MQTDCYFGTYARFDTVSKKDASFLLGADNLVGDLYDIVYKTENGITQAWLKNRFGSLIGFLDKTTSRQLNIYTARGWKIKAVLSFIAFTDSPDPGHYWGEVALICFDQSFSACFEPFVSFVLTRMGEGIRTDVNLGKQGIQKLIGNKKMPMPTKTLPLPEHKPGTVIMKSKRKISEKLIEAGRKGNKGCYTVSIVFFLALLAGALYLLHFIGLF